MLQYIFHPGTGFVLGRTGIFRRTCVVDAGGHADEAEGARCLFFFILIFACLADALLLLLLLRAEARRASRS